MKLNLGCGFKKMDGYINVDIDPNVKPDLVADFNCALPFEEGSVDEVILEQVCEHLDDFKRFMFDIYRILKVDGMAYISVPLFPCIAAMADPDHKRFFVIENFMHFCSPKWFQPTNFSGQGLFDMTYARVIKWKDLQEPVEDAGRFFTELIVHMKKVKKDYWETHDPDQLIYNTSVVNREKRTKLVNCG